MLHRKCQVMFQELSVVRKLRPGWWIVSGTCFKRVIPKILIVVTIC